jgi:hypothetical protein
MSLLGVVMFMPLYMQVVQGVTATSSGVALLPLMGGLILSGIVCGRLVSRTGRYKVFMVGGGVLLVIGVTLLTRIGPDTSPANLAWRLALTGIGLGPAQSLFNLVAANSVPVTELGVAMSVSQFSRQIGSTVGVAIFGALLTRSLAVELPRHLPQLPGTAAHKVDLSSAQSQAMNITRIRGSVEAAMQARYLVVERAYQGDRAAVSQVLADERLPEPVKQPLRGDVALSSAQSEAALRRAHEAMSAYSGRLVEQIQSGTRLAFSNSIVQMLDSALGIVITGVLIVLFIPALPLRSGSGGVTRVEV